MRATTFRASFPVDDNARRQFTVGKDGCEAIDVESGLVTVTLATETLLITPMGIGRAEKKGKSK